VGPGNPDSGRRSPGDDRPKATSAGTRASVAGVLLEPGYSFRSGRLVTERTAAHVASFEVDGSRRQAFSIGSSEHFALPRLRRQGASTGDDGMPAGAPLTDVGVYLGWFGAATGLVHYASALAAPLERLPGIRAALDQRARRIQRSRARRRGRHPLRRSGRRGRRPWPSPRDGAPDRRGSLLVHRVCPRLGSGQSGRAGRAARRRARPSRSMRSHQPRNSQRRGRISSKQRQEGCLMNATYATKVSSASC